MIDKNKKETLMHTHVRRVGILSAATGDDGYVIAALPQAFHCASAYKLRAPCTHAHTHTCIHAHTHMYAHTRDADASTRSSVRASITCVALV